MINREAFEKNLNDPLRVCGKLSKSEVEAMLGEDVARMVAYDQRNPHHCYDLFKHILHTVQSMPPEAPMPLRVAAFFHDIGKPYVAQEKQGRLVFYGHALESAEIAQPILRDLAYSDGEISVICFYISHHDDFISWVLPTEPYNKDNPYLVEITAENVNAYIKRAEQNKQLPNVASPKELWENLLKLCYADASAQADEVYRDGEVIDTKAHKLEKVKTLQTTLAECDF